MWYETTFDNYFEMNQAFYNKTIDLLLIYEGKIYYFLLGIRYEY